MSDKVEEYYELYQQCLLERNQLQASNERLKSLLQECMGYSDVQMNDVDLVERIEAAIKGESEE